MSALRCPECDSVNLIQYKFSDYFECLDCGAIYPQEDCLVKQKKSNKIEKGKFDDEVDFHHEKEKLNHRQQNPKIIFEENDENNN